MKDQVGDMMLHGIRGISRTVLCTNYLSGCTLIPNPWAPVESLGHQTKAKMIATQMTNVIRGQLDYM